MSSEKTKFANNKLHVKVKTAKGRKISSTRWLQRQLNDPYVEKSKIDGYKSRAAYKLLEINEKFRLLKQNQVILDLGSTPGSWTQIATQKVKKSGKVVSVDLNEMDDVPGAIFLQMDFLSEASQNKIKEVVGSKFDIILSDMAPQTTGHSKTDHLRIMGLCEETYHFAKEMLKPGGSLVIKIFQGGTESEILAEMKQRFAKVKHFKPGASRQDSSEIYLVATGFIDE